MFLVKVSIIIPVYNAEKYLEKSINSIINQSLKDIEIICINDGSTDNSLNILEDFSNRYNFIKIFSQENKGPAEARNFALKHTKGEYIAYLDADDFFIDDNSLEILYNKAKENNFNIVSANLKILQPDGELVENLNLNLIKQEQTIPSEEYGIPWSFYKNIFKRSFLIDNDIYFPDYRWGEDPVFLAKVLTKTDKILTVPIDFYGFRDVDYDGLNKINTPQKVSDYINHFKDVFDILREVNYKVMFYKYFKRLTEFLDLKFNDEIKELIKSIFKDDSLLDVILPKISILIPVYNVEKFLEEALQSLLSQTFQEIELICVNDGSKDDSLTILEEFAKLDDRVRVIDKPNGGCGSARNRALEEARGDYIYFFDPDDYVMPSALEELYNNAISNDSDLVIFKVATFDEGEPVDYSTPLFNFDEVFKGADFNNFTFNYKDIMGYVLNSGFAPWTKLYKKEFLDKYDDFKFDLGVAFDDVPFHVKSMLRAEKISFSPYYFYHYRFNPNSVNNTSSNGKDIFKIVDIVEQLLKTEGYFEEFEDEFYTFKVNQYIWYMVSSNSEEYFQTAKNELSKVPKSKFNNIPAHLKNKLYCILEYNSFDEYLFNAELKELENERNNLLNINKKLSKTNDKLSKSNDKLIKKNKLLLQENKKLKKINQSIIASTSWKFTKPLRKVKYNLK